MIKYELKNHKKDGHEYIEITGYDGKLQDLVVPESIDGITVESIGNHAFSGRDDLLSVSLPKSIKTLMGFAFHDCRNLKKISLYDSLLDYYDGVCRQCDSLFLVEITVLDNWFEVVRNFLADNDKRLHFLLHMEKEDAYLTFPEFVYDFNENTMARTIQFSIEGSGYAYRECVDRRKIDFRGYDNLFKTAMVDGLVVSQEIAIGRLLYPVELSEASFETYASYISRTEDDILKRYIDEAEGDSHKLDELRRLLELKKKDAYIISDSALDKGIKYSSERNAIKVSAVLMDVRKKTGADLFDMSFI